MQNKSFFSSLKVNNIRPFRLKMFVLVMMGVAGASSLSAAVLPRISEDDAKRAAVSKASPVLPPIAKQAHLSGKVVCEFTVGEDGNVEKVDVISGNPILSAAVSQAGKNWMFKPFSGTDGKPSKVTVRMTFEL